MMQRKSVPVQGFGIGGSIFGCAGGVGCSEANPVIPVVERERANESAPFFDAQVSLARKMPRIAETAETPWDDRIECREQGGVNSR